MKKFTGLVAALCIAIAPIAAYAGGYFEGLLTTTDTMPLDQMTGNEIIPMDTRLSQGRNPQTIAPAYDAILLGKVTTDSDATTPVMTPAGMAGAPLIHYRLTGAPTANQTLTLPTVADVYSYLNTAGVINAFPKCWFVKFVNVGGTSSGTFTITTATGWGTVTTNGNVVVPVAGSRTSQLCLTSATVGVVSDYGN